MRTIGLVILSHIFGILWLPARDNYIFDFGIAVFSIFGIRRLFEAPEISTKFSVRFIGSIALVFLLALTSKQFPKIQDIQPKQLLSATIRDHVDRWAWEINRGEEPTPPRILTFFHGFARLANIADVREYQSLLSARYGRFSISERLGVPYSDVSSMPAVTGDISERFERLTGPSNSKFKMLRNQRPGVDFYYNFIVQSVPPLSCSHLRLMGINYIEAGSGAFYHGRGSPKNRLYGDAALESPMVDPTIEAIIESCSSRKISLTGRDFWIIDQPLPRAFLVPGFSPGPKLDSILARPPVSQIIKARVLRYEPNRVTAEVNTKEPGTLILTDLYSPHWTARINNKDINIEPVLDLYRGVKVESGHHVVEFRLRYPRKVLTVSVMMLGILLTLGLVFLRPITR